MAQVTQLRFDPDSTYDLKLLRITCSLCDHDELRNSLNMKGTWTQKNDTIFLEQGIRLTILNDSALHPIDVIGLKLDSLPTERREAFERRFIASDLNDFNLIYDTYPNGVARLIKDRFRYQMGEYELELDENGLIEELRYYWNDKRKRKLK